MTEESWDDNYELIFAIEFHMAECELLTADMVAAENRLSMLARTRQKGATISLRVARLRLTLYTTLDRSDRGVEVCLEYLRRSARWSPHPTSDEVRREYDRIWSQLGSRPIEELIDLPLMSNPDSLAISMF